MLFPTFDSPTQTMNYFHQQSERLRYRKLTEADITNWTTFFENNSGLQYLGLDLTLSKEVLAQNWIHKQLNRYKDCRLGLLAVELKETKELIGVGGIIPREFKESRNMR